MKGEAAGGKKKSTKTRKWRQEGRKKKYRKTERWKTERGCRGVGKERTIR